MTTGLNAMYDTNVLLENPMTPSAFFRKRMKYKNPDSHATSVANFIANNGDQGSWRGNYRKSAPLVNGLRDGLPPGEEIETILYQARAMDPKYPGPPTHRAAMLHPNWQVEANVFGGDTGTIEMLAGNYDHVLPMANDSLEQISANALDENARIAANDPLSNTYAARAMGADEHIAEEMVSRKKAWKDEEASRASKVPESARLGGTLPQHSYAARMVQRQGIVEEHRQRFGTGAIVSSAGDGDEDEDEGTGGGGGGAGGGAVGGHISRDHEGPGPRGGGGGSGVGTSAPKVPHSYEGIGMGGGAIAETHQDLSMGGSRRSNTLNPPGTMIKVVHDDRRDVIQATKTVKGLGASFTTSSKAIAKAGGKILNPPSKMVAYPASTSMDISLNDSIRAKAYVGRPPGAFHRSVPMELYEKYPEGTGTDPILGRGGASGGMVYSTEGLHRRAQVREPFHGMLTMDEPVMDVDSGPRTIYKGKRGNNLATPPIIENDLRDLSEIRKEKLRSIKRKKEERMLSKQEGYHKNPHKSDYAMMHVDVGSNKSSVNSYVMNRTMEIVPLVKDMHPNVEKEHIYDPDDADNYAARTLEHSGGGRSVPYKQKVIHSVNSIHKKIKLTDDQPKSVLEKSYGGEIQKLDDNSQARVKALQAAAKFILRAKSVGNIRNPKIIKHSKSEKGPIISVVYKLATDKKERVYHKRFY